MFAAGLPVVAAAVLLVAPGGDIAAAGPAVAPLAASGRSLSDSCRTAPPDWHVRYRTRDGHAVSGVWSVATAVTCTQGKSALAIDGYLLHNGQLVRGMDAGGRCAGLSPEACRHAGGKDRVSVPTGIAGAWQLRIVLTMRGPDTLLYDPGNGCTEDIAEMTMTCTATSAPYDIG